MKECLKRIISFFYDLYYMNRWKISKNRRYKSCLQTHELKIVVSLTSFPGRIHLVHKTIISILNQKDVKPDKIILWLATTQFKKEIDELPRSLVELCDYGLEIRWCEDLKSYKKLIPTLREFPNDIIITADDDVYYSSNWVKKLYTEYEKDSRYIYCNKATMFYIEHNQYKDIGGGKKYYAQPSFLNKLVGVGGVLYPPYSLDENILNTECFLALAPTNDDIWFWLMAVKKGTRIKVIHKNNPKPVDVLGSIATPKLSSINDCGEKLYWEQFHNIISFYPDIDEVLRNEYSKIDKKSSF